MMSDLFAGLEPEDNRREVLAEGAMVLRGLARQGAPDDLLAAISLIAGAAPFRHLSTPGGYRMSVATTSCGSLGWVSDEEGYRYSPVNPATGKPWPAMPDAFLRLAVTAAAQAGFPGFLPDACLINRYAPGAKLSLHQDRDEADFRAPIVSVSLGLPAVFLFGGLKRSDPTRRILLGHGDVVVWGGPSRLRYHAVLPVKEGRPGEGWDCRINLTFRKAGWPGGQHPRERDVGG